MRRAVLSALLAAALAFPTAGCKHLIRLPGGDIRIGQDTEPVGPIVTAEDRSGAACGPDLPACPGGTACFSSKDGAKCMTEDAACAAAGCAERPCEITESFPMRAICH